MHPHSLMHTRAMRARPCARTGFTLIEILIVITITAIISFSAVGGIINLQRSARVNEMHSRFINFLDLARNYAINGKQVTSKNCPSGNSPCVPAYFGAGIIFGPNDNVCEGAQRAYLFFSTSSDITSSAPKKENILDSYCINPKVYFQNDKDSAGVFAYTTPFGEFRTSSTIKSGTTPLSLNFCDNPDSSKACSGKTLQKSITLYSHVGVPE